MFVTCESDPWCALNLWRKNLPFTVCAEHFKDGWLFSLLPPPASQFLRHQLPPQKAADSSRPASVREPRHVCPLLRDKNSTQHWLHCSWTSFYTQQGLNHCRQSLSGWFVDELPWLQVWQRDSHGNMKVKSLLALVLVLHTHTHTHRQKRSSTRALL